MKKRGISIAAILIACVFVGTIAVTAIGIYNDYSVGLESATTRFEKLSSRTTETSEYFPAGSKDFIKTFNAAVGAPDTYEHLSLEVDGIEVYSFPAEPTQTSSVFVKSFSTRIIGGDGAKIDLAASIYTLSPATIFYRARIAFIIILAATFIACILLMYLYLSESSTQEKASKEISNNIIEDAPIYSDDEITEDDSQSRVDDVSFVEDESEDMNLDVDFEDNEMNLDVDLNTDEQEDFEEPPVPPMEESAELNEQEIPTAEEDFSAMEDVFEEQQKSFAIETEQQKPVERAEQPPAPNAEQNNEQGLFSPISGFGWESYLDTRLESELIRAASSEQDLALIMIKIPGVNSESPCYKNICEALLKFFQYKDFIFEYQDGFAAIMQNKSVDNAMESAELLYTELASVLNSAGVNSKTLMGISSRSLRLISAERLKVEAAQALVHAADDADSPIVAFRVNPEKYRKYIGTQQA